MYAKRLTLEANTVTAFEFESYTANHVVVKNETGGVIEFCDGPFFENRAAHIPAYSWQALSIRVDIANKPKFHVRAAVAGPVEIDFGSSGMGSLLSFDVAGMVPHTLTLSAGEGTTLTAALIRKHGDPVDLDIPVPLTSGATVFTGDVVKLAPAYTGDPGATVALEINGVNYGTPYTDDDAFTITVQGDTVAETSVFELTEYELTLTQGESTTLTAAVIRVAGGLHDLETPVAVGHQDPIYEGAVIRFSAATTEGAGYHVVLTIDDEEVELTEDGTYDLTVSDDHVAVSASVANGGD
jgi:hypothetical protein